MLKSLFKKTDPGSLQDNFFRLINDDWMLVSAGTLNGFNTMTASWGTTGILWNKPVAVCFIRPQRYTFEFAEKNDHFTLTFLGAEYKDALNFCGTNSGRNVDKIRKTGLQPIETPNGSVTFEQARLVLECRKLYADYFKEDNFLVKNLVEKNYRQKDFHKFFIGEIKACYQRL
ncbi:MAG: flavin reductase family protein [Bacteroidales bacterium]|nr:flavin reductase family protein [Bacteroidales bacterium]